MKNATKPITRKSMRIPPLFILRFKGRFHRNRKGIDLDSSPIVKELNDCCNVFLVKERILEEKITVPYLNALLELEETTRILTERLRAMNSFDETSDASNAYMRERTKRCQLESELHNTAARTERIKEEIAIIKKMFCIRAELAEKIRERAIAAYRSSGICGR